MLVSSVSIPPPRPAAAARKIEIFALVSSPIVAISCRSADFFDHTAMAITGSPIAAMKFFFLFMDASYLTIVEPPC